MEAFLNIQLDQFVVGVKEEPPQSVVCRAKIGDHWSVIKTIERADEERKRGLPREKGGFYHRVATIVILAH